MTSLILWRHHFYGVLSSLSSTTDESLNLSMCLIITVSRDHEGDKTKWWNMTRVEFAELTSRGVIFEIQRDQRREYEYKTKR